MKYLLLLRLFHRHNWVPAPMGSEPWTTFCVRCGRCKR